MGITEYHAKFFAHELTKRCPSDSIQKLATALVDAQVDLNPHQVEAALFAFRSPLSKGAILADEVGLGKTIEAGLLISQKWAERKRKILIISPSNLRKQWNQELEDKFFIPSMIMESKSFNEEIKNGNLNPFDPKDEIVICSFEFTRNKAAYVKNTKWDLIVVDEAHRLRNVYKPQNKIANAIKEATAEYPKVLLSATPFQNSLLELYGLVSIIDDHIFGDIKSFKNQYTRIINDHVFNELKERLKPVCKRTLRKQVLEYINYTNRKALLQEFYPSTIEQELYDKVSNYLQQERLYALPESQRKLMTLILRKLLASSTYAISGTLKSLANKLKNLIVIYEEQQKKLTQEDLTVDLAEDFETYDELKDSWSDEEEPEEEFLDFDENDTSLIKQEIKQLEHFYELAESIKKDSKGAVLIKALNLGLEATQENGASRKAIIFTESTRTQSYILEILEDSDFKDKIVLFNGSNNDPKSKQIYQNWLKANEGSDKVSGSKTADMRAALVDYFRNEAEIMIATEAAAEGINLQFCSMLINYDLPWNPQRIEQRIGRCHRYGQKFDVIVVNFLNKKNAADQRVYELLSQKFHLFDGVFGASDEILGALESGLDFERRISEICRECRTEEEIQAAFNNLQKEFEPQIDEEMSRTKKQLLENFDEEVHEKLKISLEESQRYLNKYEKWLWDITKFDLKDFANFQKDESGGYFFTLNSNPFPSEKIHSGPYRIGKKNDDSNIYRIGHPLAQMVINRCKDRNLKEALITFDYSNTDKKITILESMLGKSGFLEVYKLTISTFEDEDYILLVGRDDEGNQVDDGQLRRLFSLNASISDSSSEQENHNLDDLKMALEKEIYEECSIRNSQFFDEEMDRLDRWASDLKNSLETKLKELDLEIKNKKADAKKITTLEKKVAAQKEIKKLEKKRKDMRFNLYEAQDEVDEQKEELITSTESRLKQRVSKETLFYVKWKLV